MSKDSSKELLKEVEDIMWHGVESLGISRGNHLIRLVIGNLEYILARDWDIDVKYLKRPWERESENE